ncbi:MAG: phasin family protein [Bradyrhizobium sp.]
MQPVVNEPIEAVAAADVPPTAAPSPAEPARIEPSLAEPAMSEPAPVSLQTIANAYRDYTRKSFAEFGSFFEQLSGVRSLDKAFEVQTEFVKRAYESSVTESQKIRELHRKLARQTLEPFEGLAGKTPETHGKS